MNTPQCNVTRTLPVFVYILISGDEQLASIYGLFIHSERAPGTLWAGACRLCGPHSRPGLDTVVQPYF